jgi:hypothetical protein
MLWYHMAGITYLGAFPPASQIPHAPHARAQANQVNQSATPGNMHDDGVSSHVLPDQDRQSVARDAADDTQIHARVPRPLLRPDASPDTSSAAFGHQSTVSKRLGQKQLAGLYTKPSVGEWRRKFLANVRTHKGICGVSASL